MGYLRSRATRPDHPPRTRTPGGRHRDRADRLERRRLPAPGALRHLEPGPAPALRRLVRPLHPRDRAVPAAARRRLRHPAGDGRRPRGQPHDRRAARRQHHDQAERRPYQRARERDDARRPGRARRTRLPALSPQQAEAEAAAKAAPVAPADRDRRRRRRLGVSPEQVGSLVEASDRGLVAEG